MNLPPDVLPLLKYNDVDRAKLSVLSTCVVGETNLIRLDILEVSKSLTASCPENHLFEPKLLVSGNRARQVGEAHMTQARARIVLNQGLPLLRVRLSVDGADGLRSTCTGGTTIKILHLNFLLVLFEFSFSGSGLLLLGPSDDV